MKERSPFPTALLVLVGLAAVVVLVVILNSCEIVRRYVAERLLTVAVDFSPRTPAPIQSASRSDA